MFRNLSRAHVIQVWFVAVALAFLTAGACGAAVKAGTFAMLLAVSVVPAIIVFLLWPGVHTLTAADVLRGSDRSR
jgi:hypothetical protein